jgi:hypothetical protein
VRIKPNFIAIPIAALLGLIGAIGVTAFFTISGAEQTEAKQVGFRGVGLLQNIDPVALRETAPIHRVPEPEPVEEIDPNNPPLSVTQKYKNVQVLTDLNVQQFSRLMQALTQWVSPEQGCAYCHNTKNLASDEKYAKVVARHMLQMTRNLNVQWKSHVGETGVTCYTCHRGQPVPSGDWFEKVAAASDAPNRMLGTRAGQNTAGVSTVGNTSLPYDPLTIFLNKEAPNIRVQGELPLAGESNNRRSVKQTEHTYGLMIYMANSLGVNCTYCHNSRAFANWEQSPPPRATAWYGIRMVRDLNVTYLAPVGKLLPDFRLSPVGDEPKVACATCHKGAAKPLYGVSMIPDYPELGIEAKAPYSAGPKTLAEVVPMDPYPRKAAAKTEE